MTKSLLEVNKVLSSVISSCEKKPRLGSWKFFGAWRHRVMLVSLSDIIWFERSWTVPETRAQKYFFLTMANFFPNHRVLLTKKL